MKLYSLKPGFKKARTAAHLTQQQLADQLHVNLKTVMNWEQGLVTPPLETICRIADLLHCDIDFLTGRIECSTHDVQFIHDRTGLSESAITKLDTVTHNQPYVAGVLSQMIDHRLFYQLIETISVIKKGSSFLDAVVSHLTEGTPYVDSPADLRAVNEYQLSRILTRIVDDMKP